MGEENLNEWTEQSIQHIRQAVVDDLKRSVRLASDKALRLHIKVEGDAGVVGFYNEVVGSGSQVLELDIVVKTHLKKDSG